MTLFGGNYYEGVSAAIGVQHTQVANLGVVSDAFWRLLLCWCECCYRGPTHKSGKSGGELVTLFDRYCDDVMSFAIGVHHTIAYPGQAGLFDKDTRNCPEKAMKISH